MGFICFQALKLRLPIKRRKEVAYNGEKYLCVGCLRVWWFWILLHKIRLLWYIWLDVNIKSFSSNMWLIYCNTIVILPTTILSFYFKRFASICLSSFWCNKRTIAGMEFSHLKPWHFALLHKTRILSKILLTMQHYNPKKTPYFRMFRKP